MLIGDSLEAKNVVQLGGEFQAFSVGMELHSSLCGLVLLSINLTTAKHLSKMTQFGFCFL